MNFYRPFFLLLVLLILCTVSNKQDIEDIEYLEVNNIIRDVSSKDEEVPEHLPKNYKELSEIVNSINIKSEDEK